VLALVVFGGVLFILIYPKVYVIQGSAGGALYWNADEALLFMGGGTTGARMSYLRYGLDPLLTGVGDIHPPDNERCSKVLVIRITDKDIQSVLSKLADNRVFRTA
jgi:hypothetical protein